MGRANGAGKADITNAGVQTLKTRTAILVRTYPKSNGCTLNGAERELRNETAMREPNGRPLVKRLVAAKPVAQITEAQAAPTAGIIHIIEVILIRLKEDGRRTPLLL